MISLRTLRTNSTLRLARLNHLLIPTTKDGRDRFRHSRWGRVWGPLWGIFLSLTPLGQLLSFAAVLSTAFSLDVNETSAYLTWAGLGALCAASLLWGRLWPALRPVGLTLMVTAPRRVAVGEVQTFALDLRNESDRAHLSLRALGPYLPWDGRWLDHAPTLTRLEPGRSARLSCRARFAVRGEHHLDPFRVAALVPLGISLGPAVESEGVRFIVVPRPARIARADRLMPPPLARHQPGGVALAARTGEALDLLGLRPYRAGDQVRDLHARSWARAGTPIIREHQQEHFTRVAVVLDTDCSGGWVAGSGAVRLEAALSLCAGVIAALSRSNGELLVDLYVSGASNQPRPTLALGRSLGGVDQALDLLASVQPGPRFAIEPLLFRLRPAWPRLAGLIFIALSWDPQRERLLAAAHTAGVGARALRVSDDARDAAPASEVLLVALDAIQRAAAPGTEGLQL